jgi:WD40 repeat protein
MNSQHLRLLSILSILAAFLFACSPPKETPSPNATQVMQTAVAIVEQTATAQSAAAFTPTPMRTTNIVTYVIPPSLGTTIPVATATVLPTNSSATADNASQIIDMAFSPDNKLIAVATACGHVALYGLQAESGGIFKLDETKQDALVQFASSPHMMAFTADSKMLVLSSRGDSLDEICYTINSMMPADAEVDMVSPGMTSLSDSEMNFNIDMSFRENGSWIIQENGVSAWGFASGPFIAPVHFIFSEGVNFVVERDSDLASLIARSDGHSYVWEIGTSEAVMSRGFEELNSIDATTAFNPDATIKAVANGQDIILERTMDNQVWHVLQGGSNGGHQSQVTAITFSRDGNTLFSASEDGQGIAWGINIAIWQYFPDSPPEDLPLIWDRFSLGPGVTSLELNFDQSILAIGYGNGSINTTSISGLNRP